MIDEIKKLLGDASVDGIAAERRLASVREDGGFDDLPSAQLSRYMKLAELLAEAWEVAQEIEERE